MCWMGYGPIGSQGTPSEPTPGAPSFRLLGSPEGLKQFPVLSSFSEPLV